MAEISRQEAEAIVADIRLQNGGITEEIRQRTPVEVLVALQNALQLAGNGARLLSEELYSTKTRFIFELIQNAEDNHYSRALSRNEAPFLKFTLREETITIDSNEDGFNEANVRAICSVRQSTKEPGGGYIGAKGIGFKSVFTVAYKVHIQSGPFSFCFQHHKGDTGMGMITPHNQSHDNLPENVTTRLTLFLTHPNQFEERAKDFAEIPDPLILFLSKLKRISVCIQPTGGSSLTTLYYCEKEVGSRLRLTKCTNEIVTEKLYQVHGSTFSNLSEEETRKGQRRAEVILAFPIDGSDIPIIEPQYVYSFLPLRREGLNFLVQSDFITQADREGLRDCAWNQSLLEGVCQVFVDAVHYFCSRASLQYHWLEYLPGPEIVSPFWQKLRTMILAALRRCHILLTRGGKLRYPEDLTRLFERYCDQHGQPLLDDLDPEIYLSSNYPNRGLYDDNLKALGVRGMVASQFLARLDFYLLGPSPRILNPAFNDDWHARVIRLLFKALESTDPLISRRIRRLRIIPLFDGSLTSTQGRDVYYPDDSIGNKIPTDLGFQIVQREALKLPERLELLKELGVAACDPILVKRGIHRKYNCPREVTLANSISHLNYLYEILPKDEPLASNIFLMDQHETPIYQTFITLDQDVVLADISSETPLYQTFVTLDPEIVVADIYFETPGEYGTKQLAQKLGQEEGNRIPFRIHFLHQSYLDSISNHVKINGRSWKDWLKVVAGVRRIPRFTIPGQSGGLSPLFQHIRIYNPELLVGLLRAHWSEYEKEITPDILQTIGSTEVPCKDSKDLIPLKCTHFPLTELRNICSQTGITDTVFGHFLDVPTTSATNTTTSWDFLSNFGVGLGPDLDFFRVMIERLLTLDLEQAGNGLFEVYHELVSRFQLGSYPRLRKLFNDYPAIYIPATLQRPARLEPLQKCVWKGPRCLITAHPLAIHDKYSTNNRIKYLFKTILDLQSASISTYITELNYRKQSSEVLFGDICGIYEEIAELITQREDSTKDVRDAFERDALIYIPSSRSWHPPKACVWASDLRIGAQFGISTIYTTLKTFFLEGISIQTATVSNYVSQLHVLSQEWPPNIPKIKAVIESINQLFCTGSDLDSIRSLRCLPVRKTDGNMELASPSGLFFIVDRAEYGAKFQDKVPILDYSLGEARVLSRFFQALGLEDRCMSVAIEEITTTQQPEAEPSATLTREFRQKAKYFTRYAIHYGGNRELHNTAGLYTKLRNIAVYESGGFMKTLKLSYGPLVATSMGGSGLLHIEEADRSLKLFVPRNIDQRIRCYATHLPAALLRFLKIDPVARDCFRNVILTQSVYLDDMLDGDGIVPLPSIIASDMESNLSNSFHRNVEPGINFNSQSNNTRSIQTGTQLATDGAYPRATYSHSQISGIRYEQNPPYSSIAAERPAHPVDSHRRSVETFLPVAHESYVRVLQKVIEKAYATTFTFDEDQSLPNVAAGVSAYSTFLEGLPFGIRSQNPTAHDIKIGAAGELYIFKLLLGLNLPGFDHSNWRSTIRHEVSILPEYSTMAPWSGDETADFVYDDTSFFLTKLLVHKGRLPQSILETDCPQYYMEVKSTLKSNETRFYMSKNQYAKMRSMELFENLPINPKIYIIFRVFNLGANNMNVQTYVDPGSLQKQGRLQFTPESYAVNPVIPL
ncbi:hypothetical protein FQN57_000706 [Myotisia sp. PD_48]|nr:hypothetical protein FQN57_000706 [Myotisia sp. PD_48]